LAERELVGGVAAVITFPSCASPLSGNCYLRVATSLLSPNCKCSQPSRFPHLLRRASQTPAPCPAVTTRIMGNPQEEATQLKNQGNEAFKNQDWANAVDFYTKAIELWDKEPSFYTNRAQVRSRIAATHSRKLTSLVRQTSSWNHMVMPFKMRIRLSSWIRIMSR
jgi:hypothetical protein